MARENLPEELIEAGATLLEAVDRLGMSPQGAMWIFDHGLGDWRYYLVTSLVDTLGRRRTYRLLIDAFEAVDMPKEMTVDDVHLGSPSEEFFRVISHFLRIDGRGRAFFNDCTINNIKFDGLIYRAVQEAPPPARAKAIERDFVRKVRKVAQHA